MMPVSRKICRMPAEGILLKPAMPSGMSENLTPSDRRGARGVSVASSDFGPWSRPVSTGWSLHDQKGLREAGRRSRLGQVARELDVGVVEHAARDRDHGDAAVLALDGAAARERLGLVLAVVQRVEEAGGRLFCSVSRRRMRC